MNENMAAFIIGVLVAVVGFIIKEVSTEAVRAVRFRRRLVENIKRIVDAHKNHYPELQRLKEVVKISQWSFIWDSNFNDIQAISENFHYLKPIESSQCTRFSDELSISNEIRTVYNNAVHGVITESEKKEKFILIALACLEDLQIHNRQIINRGCKCLIELNKNHWFLQIDSAQFQEDLNKQLY
jgi:hypothetical protein